MYKLHVDLRDCGIGNSAEAEDLPEEDPEGPDVTLVVDHPGLQNLRRHPPDGEAGADVGEVLHGRVEGAGEPKVGDLGHGLVLVQQDVPGGEIPVDDLISLKELHALANLKRNDKVA